MAAKYPISEIFYSIQGEGYHIGKSAIFIRFAGCNLNCSWCDTNHRKKTELTSEQIMKKITQLVEDIPVLPPLFIVLTGGEPTIQHRLGEVIRYIKRNIFCYIAIETNGTNPRTLERLYIKSKLIDWITVSPKSLSNNVRTSISLADELKIVLAKDCIDPNSYRLKRLEQNGRLYIQPCSQDFKPAVDFVLKNPWWRLSVQIQKIVDVL